MELTFKLLKDQPPLMGVLFDNELKASKSFEELLYKYRDDVFTAELEITNRGINLILISEKDNSKVPYTQLEFNPERLKYFTQYIKPNTPFKFAHFYKLLENPVIAQPSYNKKPGLLSVKGYTIASEN